jgi:hypothetical protein
MRFLILNSFNFLLFFMNCYKHGVIFQARISKILKNSGFRFLFIILPALLGICRASLGSEGEPGKNHPFRFAFSSTLMVNVNENDARAAMKVWAETLVGDGTVRAEPNVLFCPDIPTMVEVLQTPRADGLAAPITEYYDLRSKIDFNRCVLGVESGTIFHEYLLLVHVDSGISRIDALKGRTLNMLENSRMCLAIPWLDILLHDKGMKPVRGFSL